MLVINEIAKVDKLRQFCVNLLCKGEVKAEKDMKRWYSVPEMKSREIT